MTDTSVPTVDEFRSRARDWLARTMPPASVAQREDDDSRAWELARTLQRTLSDGGFAGICFPREYGGLGLGHEYQQAFTEEAEPYDMPVLLNVPSLAICGATLLDTGTEQQKLTYLPRIISGEDVWCQLLSEPRGGSDLAGVTTRAVRDGDEWVVNGTKIWSSAAYAADYGLCLTRTDWDVPKHSGLTMMIMPLDAPGVTIHRIRLVSGSTEFCQVFFDDVRLPADAVVGEVNDGWATASQQLFHERNLMGGGSPYVSGPRFRPGAQGMDLVELARRTAMLDDPLTRDQIAQIHVMDRVSEALVDRMGRSIASGAVPPTASTILRLFDAERSWQRSDAEVRIAGSTAVSGRDSEDKDLGVTGLRFLSRQGVSLGGGSTEMARNIISERVLGMPREAAPDKGVPFREVKQRRTD